MAKHPELNEVIFRFPDGHILKTMSTLKEGTYPVDVPYIDDHPAWKKGGSVTVSSTNEKLKKFGDKYGNLF